MGKEYEHCYYNDWGLKSYVAALGGEAIAKSHGKRTDGRERIELPNFQNFLEKQKDGLLTVDECCSELGISRRTWYNRVKEMAV